MSVWRWTRRRICGGKVSMWLSPTLRYSRSVQFTNTWAGISTILPENVEG
ncbi:hypothetical protein E2C01_079685 [Portunus trituberculatus]|uniref:Uncharacterized protein n=1 Tax=Portunus trituberculatus TaxID=210409 RepID=A0A5B7IHJ0_PORTR|nr:hypothetical protein [Portunus trituberculatus]